MYIEKDNPSLLYSFVNSFVQELKLWWYCIYHDKPKTQIQCIYCRKQNSHLTDMLRYDGRFYYHPDCRTRPVCKV